MWVWYGEKEGGGSMKYFLFFQKPHRKSSPSWRFVDPGGVQFQSVMGGFQCAHVRSTSSKAAVVFARGSDLESVPIDGRLGMPYQLPPSIAPFIHSRPVAKELEATAFCARSDDPPNDKQPSTTRRESKQRRR